jgi:cytochrome b561
MVRYGTVPQFLHWTTVILVIVAWVLGTVGDDLPKGAARTTGLFVHISAGLLILMGLIVRLAWRVADPPPPPEPNEFGRWLGAFADPAARFAHYALYALLIAVPVSGIIEQFARGDALPLLGISEIPSPWTRDRTFAHTVKEFHEIMRS